MELIRKFVIVRLYSIIIEYEWMEGVFMMVVSIKVLLLMDMSIRGLFKV